MIAAAFDEREARQRLRDYLTATGKGVGAVARECGLSHAAVSHMLAGRKRVTGVVAAKIGLKPVHAYVELER